MVQNRTERVVSNAKSDRENKRVICCITQHNFVDRSFKNVDLHSTNVLTVIGYFIWWRFVTMLIANRKTRTLEMIRVYHGLYGSTSCCKSD